ncbi:MAG: hypothetical protein OEU92_07905 [Alphaproteobacteria bacterium]|nr:hypothetical protein [Alphaproteobacteria bacterium]
MSSFKMLGGHGCKQRGRAGRCAGLVVATALFLGPIASQATEITAADGFRAASDLVAEVRLLHDANYTTPPGNKLLRKQTVYPRHVLQLARTVLRKANTLAWISGGETVLLGPMPTQMVRPSDVLEKLEATDWVIQGLKPIFGVAVEIAPAPLDASKTPNDVYAALYRLSQMIDGLGIPKTVPNDIYQLADAIVFELAIIRDHYGAPKVPLQPRDRGKDLRDVYGRVFVLADTLGQLAAARPELAPVGGVIRPSRRRGVTYALNDILADVVEMRATTGRLDQAERGQVVSGMTPSHVYQRLDAALAIIRALAEKNA